MKVEIEKKAQVFYSALANVYRDGDAREEVSKLPLGGGGDFVEDLTAILIAAKVLAGNIMGNVVSEDDLIGFTHMLNRAAIQFLFNSEGWDGENTETIELNKEAGT